MSPARRRGRERDRTPAGPGGWNEPADAPADRFAAALARGAEERTELARFRERLAFELDDFQVAACRAVEGGRGVLVAAPTGAGKTVVGEFAVHLGLRSGRKAFYTTPIKALSNQKYTDLVAVHGPDRVGLLTGDTTINGDAPVVVMTTEVLRNMLYAGSSTLDGLGFVVMDEVHFLADRFRGAVWEEVIIHLADDVQLVSLSATVSNAEEFGQWLATVRGDTAVVVSERRPVPLWQHVMVRDAILDLYSAHVDPTEPGPNPPINPELAEAVRRAARTASAPDRAGRPRGARPGGARGVPGTRGGPGRGGGVRAPSRPVVVDRLDRAGLLPAIVFVFSRAGCDAAVAQVVAAGLRLTTPEERARIQGVIDERCATLPPEDLDVLGFWSWSHALTHGIAAHHAGLLPVFKETVETLFSAGLIKVVFATETLALGINMPARSVVLERLVKWDGHTHAEVTAGEYTQLTGRAGRRGIDVEGHAVVLYSEGVDPVALAGLASRRTYPLRSSFAPTYNMAVNLVAQTGHTRAREVLETSFAQFQADRAVVGLARQARSHAEALEGYAEAMRCHLGDFAEYAALRRAIGEREAELSRARSRERRDSATASLGQARPGDVVESTTGRRPGYAVVLEATTGIDGPRLTVLTQDRQVRRLSAADVPSGVRQVARVRIPKDFSARRPADRRDLASSLRAALQAVAAEEAPAERRHGGARTGPAADAELARLRSALRAHPCHGCADREEHARWAERWARLSAEHAALVRRIEGRTSSIARDFDRVCDVLTALGYLRVREDAEAPDDAAVPGALAVTPEGQWLRRIYTERDLVLAECLRAGAWDDLDAAALAAVCTAVLYESRTDEPLAMPHLPGGPHSALALAVERTVRLADELAALERDHRITPAAPLDLALVPGMYEWARGGTLAAVLRTCDLAAGDFVRWAKQVLDLLDQISLAAPQHQVRRRAHEAVARVRRGVVAHSAV
jgi:ATP-dependent RNA helicase HelY